MPPRTSASARPTCSAGSALPSSSATAASATSTRQRFLVSTTSRNSVNDTVCVARRPSPAKTSTSTLVRSRKTTANTTNTDAPNRPGYGELVESDQVHDDIRALGTQVQSLIARRLPRHGTSAAQVAWGVRQFGPSWESRAVLNRENEAAKLAWETGVYCVWRCTDVPKLRAEGANNDFCCRLGYRHVCFCGHPMAAHTVPSSRASNSSGGANSRGVTRTLSGAAPVSDRQLAQWKAPCEEAGCGCSAFQYIPNTPLEIGEGWLTRRADWNASQWSAKCRCGHGHKAHDPSAVSRLRCRSCGGCTGFTSAFLCVVCDLPWEAHATVWESEETRVAAGLPVREAYAPLAGMDRDLRELVLTDATMDGKIEPPAVYLALQARQGGVYRSPTRRRLPDPASPPKVEEMPEVADPVLPDVEYCPACATIYRSAASNFCSKCGQPRPRRPSTLR